MDRANMTADEYVALRKQLGMSQQGLATALGIAVSTVSKREQGVSPIDDEAALAIRALCDGLGADEPATPGAA